MVGGYLHYAGGELKGEYKNLPPHTQVRVKANLYLIDGWRKGEGVQLKFGQKLKAGQTMEGNDGCDVLHTVWTWTSQGLSEFSNQESVCGGPVAEEAWGVPVDVTFSHAADDLVLAWQSSVPFSALEQVENSHAVVEALANTRAKMEEQRVMKEKNSTNKSNTTKVDLQAQKSMDAFTGTQLFSQSWWGFASVEIYVR